VGRAIHAASREFLESDVENAAPGSRSPEFVRQRERRALASELRERALVTLLTGAGEGRRVRREQLAIPALGGLALGAFALFLFADLFASLRREDDRRGDHRHAQDDFHPTLRTLAPDDGEAEKKEDRAESEER